MFRYILAICTLGALVLWWLSGNPLLAAIGWVIMMILTTVAADAIQHFIDANRKRKRSYVEGLVDQFLLLTQPDDSRWLMQWESFTEMEQLLVYVTYGSSVSEREATRTWGEFHTELVRSGITGPNLGVALITSFEQTRKRMCTCLGICKGVEGLAKGWWCASDNVEGKL